MNKNNIIAEIEREQMSREVPEFAPGDTVVVQVKVKEGNRERLQAFEGVVIGVRKRGLNSAFTLRKVSHGVGVERTFQTYSPLIESITVKRRGDVRQAKLYYLRERSGRSARIREKINRSGKAAKAAEMVPEEGTAVAPEAVEPAPPEPEATTADAVDESVAEAATEDAAQETVAEAQEAPVDAPAENAESEEGDSKS